MKKLLLTFFTILMMTGNGFAQSIPSSSNGTTRCAICAPSSWFIEKGTPDISDKNSAANSGTNGGGANWTQNVNGISNFTLPLPPNGHQTWITIRDLGSIDSEEIIRTEMKGLVLGKEYEIVVYSLSAVTRANGQNNQRYASAYSDKFDFQVGTTSSPRISVTDITRNVWGMKKLRFTATSNTMNIYFYPGYNAAGTTSNYYEAVNISVSLNAINAVPIALDDFASTLVNTPVQIPVTANDSDSDGTINVASVDLDPSTPGIQNNFTTAEGVWTVNSNGIVTFSPNPGFVGTATTPYMVWDNYTQDGASAAASAPANITVNVVQSCVTGCNDNAFLNTTNPNTLEYDNMISGYHSTIIKQTDGNFMIWGQGTKPNTFFEHLYEPTLITPANGFTYQGTLLKAAMGTFGASSLSDGRLDIFDQFAVLSTEGLYVWGGGGGSVSGYTSMMLHTSVKNTYAFEKMTAANITNANTYGLPMGVNPSDVKMMFGSHATLAITTCSGEAYVLSYLGNKNGDGTSDNATNVKTWHRVMINATTPLSGVVAMRGTMAAFMALTASGEIYTWGTETYLGNGSGKANRLYATKMTLPTGITPKMIGMTIATARPNSVNNFTVSRNAYYLLSTTGELYSLGDNSERQLGTFDVTEQKSWVRVKGANSSTNMTNIVWISPNEHDGAAHAAVTALTSDGKLWGWGMNANNMLGQGENGGVDPRLMFGGLNATDKILAVETGGHLNTIFKECTFKLGYIGHNVHGSYANNTGGAGGTVSDVFVFAGPNFNNLCAIPLPVNPIVKDLKICRGHTANLGDALLSTTPSGYTLEWWTTINRSLGTQVGMPYAVGPDNYYAFYIANDGSTCSNIEGVKVMVSYFEPGEPEYKDCYCTKPGDFTSNGTPTKVGITVQQKQAGWPENIPNGWVTLESKTKGMVITRVQNSDLITDAKEGMLIYDIDAKCVKLYNGSIWACIEQSCND